jgi:protein-disulfide isomerase
VRSLAAARFAVILTTLGCKPAAPQPRAVVATMLDARAPTHCQILRDRLCAEFGTGSDVCAMAKVQTDEFAPERCAGMLSRYEQTAASALRYAEGKQALIAREQLTPHGLAPSLGSADARLTLVLFSDFSDPEAGRAAPLATTIKNLYPDEVRLVFRQFPSPRRAGAHLAAQASLAAHAQGKFWAFHDVLFGNPQAHDRAALERYARAAGLDLPRFRKALDQRTFAPDVDADIELGRKLGLQATPALFANGRQVSVPYGVDELARIVEGSGPAQRPRQ